MEMVTFRPSLKSLLLTTILLGCSASLSAQTVAGKWCVETNPADCLLVTVATASPEVVTAVFQENGKTYAEATGFFRDTKLSLAFRRTNSRDLGFVTFQLTDAKRADGRTFNADGSQRWRGVYLR
jgi:hypothetical protein